MQLFWKALRRSGIDLYEHLGLVALTSLVVGGASLIGLAGVMKLLRVNPLLALIVLECLYAVVGAPLAAGLAHVSKGIAARDSVSLGRLFSGAREFLVPAWKLGAAQALISLLLIVNIGFYITRDPMPVKIVGVLLVYVLVFWAMGCSYHFPILVEQRAGALVVLKRGALLTLGNLAFTAWVFFAIIVLVCLCVVTIVGMPLILPAAVSILQTHATRALFAKYGVSMEMPDYMAAGDPDVADSGADFLGASDDSTDADPEPHT